LLYIGEKFSFIISLWKYYFSNGWYVYDWLLIN